MKNEYDPERGLWVMGRRRFLCFSAAAAVGVMLPSSTFHPDYFQIVVPMPQLEVVPVASMAEGFRQGVSFSLDSALNALAQRRYNLDRLYGASVLGSGRGHEHTH